MKRLLLSLVLLCTNSFTVLATTANSPAIKLELGTRLHLIPKP